MIVAGMVRLVMIFAVAMFAAVRWCDDSARMVVLKELGYLFL
jgi:hypothetical protein